MSKKIKIAQIVGNSREGGIINFVFNYFKHIDKNRFQFDFFSYGPGFFDEELKKMGANIYYMPSVKNIISCKSFLKKAFKENKYDIVHSQITSLSFVPLMVAKRAGIKTRICHAHSSTNEQDPLAFIKNLFKKFSIYYATDLWGCSQLAIDWMYSGTSREKTLILNAIDLERFKSSESKKKLGKKTLKLEDKFVVGSFGRFVYQKNPKFNILAFNEFQKLVDNAVLMLVGQGKLLQECKNLAEELGISNKILFLPEIKDVPTYYNALDVFWLPSIFEGLPLVLLEAQAAGIKCFDSEFITKEANITNEITYLRIDNPENWAKQTLAFYKSQYSYNGSEILAKNGFDIVLATKTLENHYERLIKDNF
jgi:glycosyltransferase involved in cell wall biosynthesis